jgi:hypothetical protein
LIDTGKLLERVEGFRSLSSSAETVVDLGARSKFSLPGSMTNPAYSSFRTVIPKPPLPSTPTRSSSLPRTKKASPAADKLVLKSSLASQLQSALRERRKIVGTAAAGEQIKLDSLNKPSFPPPPPPV